MSFVTSGPIFRFHGGRHKTGWPDQCDHHTHAINIHGFLGYPANNMPVQRGHKDADAHELRTGLNGLSCIGKCGDVRQRYTASVLNTRTYARIARRDKHDQPTM